jgi:hypothetical protein
MRDSPAFVCLRLPAKGHSHLPPSLWPCAVPWSHSKKRPQCSSHCERPLPGSIVDVLVAAALWQQSCRIPRPACLSSAPTAVVQHGQRIPVEFAHSMKGFLDFGSHLQQTRVRIVVAAAGRRTAQHDAMQCSWPFRPALPLNALPLAHARSGFGLLVTCHRMDICRASRSARTPLSFPAVCRISSTGIRRKRKAVGKERVDAKGRSSNRCDGQGGRLQVTEASTERHEEESGNEQTDRKKQRTAQTRSKKGRVVSSA